MTIEKGSSPASLLQRYRRTFIVLSMGLVAATTALALSPAGRQTVVNLAVDAPTQLIGGVTGPASVGLRVTTATPVTRIEEKNFTGAVVARYETPVSFRVGGKILLREIETGTIFRSGQVLMQLDQADLRAAVSAAEAGLAAARSEEKRAAAEEARQAILVGDGWVAQGAYDRAIATLDAAREAVNAAAAKLTIANNNLAYTKLVAQEAGIVTSILAEAGQVVAAGQSVATVIRPGAVEAEVGIPEGQIEDLGTWTASASVWSAPELWSNATLREIAPVADPVGRTHRARFGLTEAPDLGATVTIRLQRVSDGLLTPLPTTALAYSDDQPFVWVLTPDGQGVRRQAVTVASLGADLVWLDGVPVDAAVVTLGVHRLDENLVVHVVETVAPPVLPGQTE